MNNPQSKRSLYLSFRIILQKLLTGLPATILILPTSLSTKLIVFKDKKDYERTIKLLD